MLYTMWPGDLAPDDTDLGAPDLLLTPVDVGNSLAKVEAVILYQYAISFNPRP